MASNVKSRESAIDEMLQCSLCLEQIKAPRSLLCLHSFCKPCIEAVPQKKHEGKQGWFCPMCRTFSAKETLKENFFINDLLDIHNSDGTSLQKSACKQCPDALEANWKCIDCRLDLCAKCQVIHLMIPLLKGHTVVPIDTETEKVVDRLVFCTKHNDKPIEFNCQECEIPLCIKCKIIDHNIHETETVEMALERLLPKMEKNSKYIALYKATLPIQIKAISYKIDETKKMFSACKTDLCKQVQNIIEHINAVAKKKESMILEEETKAIKVLEKAKQKLENKLSEITNLTHLVDTATGNARHTSLLNEIQGGLFKRVQENVKSNEDQVVHIEVHLPRYQIVKDSDEKFEMLDELIGEMSIHKSEIFVDVEGEIKTRQSTILCPDIVRYFSEHLEKVKDIFVPEWAYRISYIDGQIWICFPAGEIIQIYATNGKLIQSLDEHGHSFCVIKKSYNNHLLAGGEDGLYVSMDSGRQWTMVDDRSVTDLCVYGENLSVLEHRTNAVITFIWNRHCEKWNQTSSFQVNGLKEHRCNRLIYDGQYLLISEMISNCVVKYTVTGEKLLQYNTDFIYPRLCGCDSTGHVLLANYSDHSFHIMTNEVNTMADTEITVNMEVPQYPRDVVADSDNNLWVLSGFKEYKLTKYVP